MGENRNKRKCIKSFIQKLKKTTILSFMGVVAFGMVYTSNAYAKSIDPVDIDKNGTIEIYDLANLAISYNVSNTSSDFVAEKDINKDNIIDIYDLTQISKRMGYDDALVPGVYEESMQAIKYNGSWTNESNANHSDGAAKTTTIKGNNIEFKFYGTGFEWYGLHSTNSGKVNVYLDGKLLQSKNLNLFDSFYNKLAVVKDGLTEGIHTVQIENVSDTSSSKISVDRIIINNSTIKDNDFRVYQSNGSTNTYVGRYGDEEEAVKHASLYSNTYVNNSEKAEIWTNSYKVNQRLADKSEIFVGRYGTEEDALKIANNYQYSYISAPDGDEIWTSGYPAIMKSETIVEGGPGTSYSNIGKVFNQEKVAILSVEDDFYHIEYLIDGTTNRKRGYVPTSSVNSNYTITSNENMRISLYSNSVVYSSKQQEVKGAPTTSSTKLATIFLDEEIQVLQQQEDFSLIECETPNGKVRGYVPTSTLNATPSIVKGYVRTNGANLNVRAGTGETTAIIGKLANGSVIDVVDTDNKSWYKIKYGSGYGYVSSTYVSLTTTSNTTTGYVATNGANLNVRTGPSESNSIIGKVSNGSSLTIVDTSISGWYKIKYGSGYGYVSKTYVTLTPKPNNNGSVPSDVKVNLNSTSYKNMFSRGQCTWFGYGRTKEKLGITLPSVNVRGYSGVSPHNPNSFRSHAKYWWYDNIALNKMGKGYRYGSTPKANSLIIWTRGTYGHVAFVEKVDGDRVYITESNYDGKGNYRAKWWTLDQIKTYAKGQTYGYIYLQ